MSQTILALQLVSEIIQLSIDLDAPLDTLTPEEILEKIDLRKDSITRFTEA